MGVGSGLIMAGEGVASQPYFFRERTEKAEENGKIRLVTCSLRNGMQLFTESREWSCNGTL